jgi:hypothetical protein
VNMAGLKNRQPWAVGPQHRPRSFDCPESTILLSPVLAEISAARIQRSISAIFLAPVQSLSCFCVRACREIGTSTLQVWCLVRSGRVELPTYCCRKQHP